MSTETGARRRAAGKQATQAQRLVERRRRRNSRIGWSVGIMVIVSVITIGLLTSRPTESAAASAAPDFTLTDTDGRSVSLADYRGRNVILYFSEGAGCQSCLVQMAQIEKDKAAFDAANITVLPIVMNTRDQIMADMAANGVATPFLLDDGQVSSAYDTLGKGMHAGLPGHSFFVIDSTGVQRWYGEYPSMWMEPSALLAQATSVLAG